MIPVKFIPQGNNPVSSMTLIEQSLRAGGFSNLQQFYETAFANMYGGVKWTSLFDVAAPTMTETYTQIKSKKGLPVMARYVAFDAEAPLISRDSFAIGTGTMPKMKLGTMINEKSIKETLYIISQANGNPVLNPIYEQFLVDQAKLLSGLHAQINFTGFQIESTGKYISTDTNNGGGLIGLEFDFNVPAAHKRGCGGWGVKGAKKTWSDPTANPIGDLRDMAQYAEDNFIPYGVFRMNKVTWNVFIDHPEVKRQVALFITKGLVSDTNLGYIPVDKESVQRYLVSLDIPQIEVVDDRTSVESYDPATRKTVKRNVRGFADNTVLLRPAGKIGQLQWTPPSLDFATNDNPAFLTEGGKFAVRKFVSPKEQAMEFQADFTGLPVLDIPDYMLYLDISTAAA